MTPLLRPSNLTHVTANDTPGAAILARPDSGVPVRAAVDRSGYFDGESGSQCSHGDILAHESDAQLLRLVGAEADDTRAMRLEILGLGSELAVRTGEQELLGDEVVQDSAVTRQLCGAKLRLAGDDLEGLAVGVADQYGTHDRVMSHSIHPGDHATARST